MPNDGHSRGVELTTLAITAVASAAAAYVCSRVWAPGTLPSAAFTPVLVALIKEALQRPTEVVSRAVPVRGVVRSADTHGDAPTRGRDVSAENPERRRDLPEEEPTRRRHIPAEDPARRRDIHEDKTARVAQPGMIPGARRSSRSGRRWRLAVVTGLLGFVVCALVLTVPELVAGQSASGGGRETTLFGGKAKKKRERTTQTTTAPTSTATTPDPTAPPAATAPAPATPAPPPASPTPDPAPDAPAPPAQNPP